MSFNKSIEKFLNENYEDNGAKQISLLLRTVPILNELFSIHYKVGEGTFSSVYLATLKNSLQSKNFAVKHLIPTCHPGRIERELQCLKDIGGKDYVVGLDLCLRHAGSVVFVMPFMKHDKFSDYVQDMKPIEMKGYMKALLTALHRVHKFNIIHRDIKPSNFLYDRSNKKYLLVDFGLAQQYTPGVKIKNINSEINQNKFQYTERKSFNENTIDRSLKTSNKPVGDKCYCFGKSKICSLCLIRPSQAASRAGTPGFRAPEVLLKYPWQTPAIDIWACGVMMLSILSGTQPLFRSPDDMTALAEITAIFGSNAMQQCARNLGKKLIFSSEIPGIDIVLLCQKLQTRKKYSKSTASETFKQEIRFNYPEDAYNLLAKLLDIDYKTRITADQALLHPFFNS
ncbi:PREDICTED: cell division cycle 7-related protein kinase-like [Ceratosolen solmsi marchali]|uniref:non-specific serine/threonine protein kinase n=1 Tax=Ceratosolen solmsi marchali TaxID=326594 RepID=A0AAJ6YC77_9HYME|nr:PREDICTED: cell division cycle 7-related protein kinase-like [Ceratosolen solmsi marchali]